MARGGYLGGSTVVGPRSGWFTLGNSKKRKRPKNSQQTGKEPVEKAREQETIIGKKAKKEKRKGEAAARHREAQEKKKRKHHERYSDPTYKERQVRRIKARKKAATEKMARIEIVRRPVGGRTRQMSHATAAKKTLIRTTTPKPKRRMLRLHPVRQNDGDE